MLVVGVGGLVGCGDDSDDEDPDGAQESDSEAADDEEHEQPEINDETFFIVQDLLAEFDSLTQALSLDQEAFNDPDSDDMAALRELFTDDSVALETALVELEKYWEAVDESEENPGIHQQISAWAPGSSDPDTATFQYCHTFVSLASILMFGEGEAHRVDGAWRIHELSVSNVGVPTDTVLEQGCSEETNQLDGRTDES